MLAGSDDATLYLRTDLEAEAGRLVAVDLDAFKDRTGPLARVVAESENTLLDARAAGDGFILVYSPTRNLRSSGPAWMVRRLGDVEVAGGAVVGLNAERGDDEAFIGLSSVTSPTHSYLIETSSAAVTSLAGAGTASRGRLRSPSQRS